MAEPFEASDSIAGDLDRVRTLKDEAERGTGSDAPLHTLVSVLLDAAQAASAGTPPEARSAYPLATWSPTTGGEAEEAGSGPSGAGGAAQVGAHLSDELVHAVLGATASALETLATSAVPTGKRRKRGGGDQDDGEDDDGLPSRRAAFAASLEASVVLAANHREPAVQRAGLRAAAILVRTAGSVGGSPFARPTGGARAGSGASGRPALRKGLWGIVVRALASSPAWNSHLRDAFATGCLVHDDAAYYTMTALKDFVGALLAGTATPDYVGIPIPDPAAAAAVVGDMMADLGVPRLRDSLLVAVPGGGGGGGGDGDGDDDATTGGKKQKGKKKRRRKRKRGSGGDNDDDDDDDDDDNGTDGVGGSRRRHAFLSEAKHRSAFSDLWLVFLRLPLPATTYKRLLRGFHTEVLPHIEHPILLADFLTDSYSVGGVVGVLALASLMTLIQDYGLDYPDFFKQLYALLTPAVFHYRERGEFFAVTGALLRSKLVPAYLVAAFAKRIARLALSAPPHGCLFALAFVYNLLLRHPACIKLVQADAGLSPFDAIGAARASAPTGSTAGDDDDADNDGDEAGDSEAEASNQTTKKGKKGKKGGRKKGKELATAAVAATTDGDEDEEDPAPVLRRSSRRRKRVKSGNDNDGNDDDNNDDGNNDDNNDDGNNDGNDDDDDSNGDAEAGNAVDVADMVLRDPFDPDADDPAACGALESSLWELRALQNHYAPSVSRLAQAFNQPLSRKRKFDLDVFTELDFESLFSTEIRRKSKKGIALAYATPTDLFSYSVL